MRFIAKDGEPEQFADWKAAANDAWQPSYDNLSGAPKQALKQALMREQGFLCCYCEQRLIDADSHIEHFKPQSDAPADALDFSNLLCSCQRQIKKGQPRHCGNLKDDWFDDKLLVSPLDPDCARHFTYSGDGRIHAAPGDLAAEETIKRPGPGLPKLNALRAKAIEPFLDDDLDDDLFRQFVAAYLQPNSEGQLGEFSTMIEHLFRAPVV